MKNITQYITPKKVLSSIGILIIVVFLIWHSVYVLPGKYAASRVQYDEIFQVFEQKYPGVRKEVSVGKLHYVEQRAQVQGGKLILTHDWKKRVSLRCEGQSGETAELLYIPKEDFKTFVQKDGLCESGINRTWQMEPIAREDRHPEVLQAIQVENRPLVEQMPEVLKVKEIYPQTFFAVEQAQESFHLPLNSSDNYYLTVRFAQSQPYPSLFCLHPETGERVFEKHGTEVLGALENETCNP